MSSAKPYATGKGWVSQLASLYFDVQYRKGHSNANANALSLMSNQQVNQTLQLCPLRVCNMDLKSGTDQPTQEPDNSLRQDLSASGDLGPQSPRPSEPYRCAVMESLPAMTTQEIRAGQKEDPVIGLFWYYKSRNLKPCRSERIDGGRQVCLL